MRRADATSTRRASISPSAAISPTPPGWTAPRRIVKNGFWYPQAIGLGPGDGDTAAGLVARFFIAGVSEWEIRFGPAARADAAEIEIDKAPLDPGW